MGDGGGWDKCVSIAVGDLSGSDHVIDLTIVHVDFLFGLFFDHENGGDMFLRNVG
jgi:hypothetical protein